MVSASEVPVSMTIVLAAAAEQLVGLAGRRDWSPTSSSTDRGCPGLLQPFRGGCGERRVELFMQRKLLAQRLAKLIVIVDDEDLARVAHRWPLA